MAPVVRTCCVCGTQAETAEGGLPEGWSLSSDRHGRVEFLCADCARTHIRAIEGKLPEEYW